MMKTTRKVWLILILVHMGYVTQFTQLNTVKDMAEEFQDVVFVMTFDEN